MRKFSGETGWQLGSLGREGFALRKESSASTCLCYICYISSVNVALLNIFAYLFLWSLCFSSSSTWNILTSHPKRQESKRASKCSSGLLLDSDQSEGPQVWQKVSPTTCLYGWTIEYEWTVASEEPLHSPLWMCASCSTQNKAKNKMADSRVKGQVLLTSIQMDFYLLPLKTCSGVIQVKVTKTLQVLLSWYCICLSYLLSPQLVQGVFGSSEFWPERPQERRLADSSE